MCEKDREREREREREIEKTERHNGPIVSNLLHVGEHFRTQKLSRNTSDINKPLAEHFRQKS